MGLVQVVGELRSQYAIAVKMAVKRLTDVIFSQPGASPAAILDELCHMSGSASVRVVVPTCLPRRQPACCI